MIDPPFAVVGEPAATLPVLLSVPHAGRASLPPSAPLRIPQVRLRALEDRYADALVTRAVEAGAVAMIAQVPRLWIDLNRAENDVNPASITGAIGAPVSERARGGLGLIPDWLPGVGALWQRPLEPEEVNERIASVHQPYHAKLSQLLETISARFGFAILLDIHSMPSLLVPVPPHIVLGDRFGSSASAEITALAESLCLGVGYRVALNRPYAGGHIISTHGKPHRGVHAVQIEVDRAAYLDDALDQPGAGLIRVQRLIADITLMLGTRLAIAAP